MANYGRIGDAINAVQLLGLTVYAYAVIGHACGWWNLKIFGSNWATDGFCLSFKDTFFHSHLLCFYGDTMCAIILLILSRFTYNRPELNLVKENVASVFFHGVVHGFLWWRGPIAEQQEKHTVAAYVIIFMFFFSFMHLMTKSPLWASCLQSAFHTVVLTEIPMILAFTYVNTAIGINLNLAHVFTSPRDVYYVLWFVFYSTPVIIATFAEPLLCDGFLVNWGGHILFDMSIPFGTLLYYAVACQYPPRVADRAAKTA